MKKLIRITTVPQSLGGLLKGQLNYMKRYYYVIGIASYSNGILDEVSKKEGIPAIVVEMTRKITPVKDLRAVLRLYRIFRREKPFIVHTHTPKAGTLGMLAARLAGVPHRLHTIAGLPLLEAKGPKRKLLDLVEKITYSCATKIYPNSNNLKKVIINNGYTTSAKLFVIGNGSSNGINTQHFSSEFYSESQNRKFRRQLGINDNDFVFIYVGRFVRDKGIHELVSSFEALSSTEQKVKLLMVGSYERDLDPLEKRTEDMIHSHKAIIPVGWQHDVRPYFAASDCLLFPSYREGFPNVVMQAGAMGLFSIVSDINGCNEIIIQRKNGIIIPPKSETELLNAMKLVLQDKNRILNERELYRKLIQDRYEQAFVWSEIKKEYDKLLKDPS